MKWRYTPWAEIRLKGELLWPSDLIYPVATMPYAGEANDFCKRFLATVHANATPFVVNIEDELAALQPPPFFRGARLFDQHTGREFERLLICGDHINGWGLANILFHPFHHHLQNLRAITPILAREGVILHLAVDADIRRTVPDDFWGPAPAYQTFDADLLEEVKA